MNPRYAPIRYKVCCLHGWHWRTGYAIQLPAHPAVRMCANKQGQEWRIDNFDTGFAMPFGGRSRAKVVRILLEALPRLLAGGRFTQRVKRCAPMIRRARALGESV